MFIEPLERRTLRSATYYVSPQGDDAADGATPATAWRHVQHAFDAAPPGSTVDVTAGHYREHLTLRATSSAAAGYTTFQAVGHVTLDGTGATGTPVLSIAAAHYVRVIGFDVVNFTTRHGGAAVLFEGAGDHVQLLNNKVHHTRGFEATAIGVYGTDPAVPISDLTLDGNTVYDCQPADSETVTLNGNVTAFAVTNNTVRAANNIGIDFIGGEGTSPDPATDAARGGTCAGNHVTRAHSNYGGGYAAGIYVDGGRDITVERNTVDHSDLGIEVGCEHAGRTTTGVVGRPGVAISGDAEAGVTGTGNTSDHNLFFSNAKRGRMTVGWMGKTYGSAAAYRAATGQGAHDVLADPKLVGPTDGNVRLTAGSPAVDAGDPDTQGAGDVDLYGSPRLVGPAIDIGAAEAH